MSTNYYLITTPEVPVKAQTALGEVLIGVDHDDPQTHVGKRYGAGNGRMGFTWCQQPDAVKTACEDNPETAIIEDEYGDRFTGQRFLDEVLAKVTVERYLIGERFL